MSANSNADEAPVPKVSPEQGHAWNGGSPVLRWSRTTLLALLILLIGHLQSVARDVWLGMGNGTAVEKAFSAVVAVLVPDFGSFGILDDILAGTHVPWAHVVQLSAYAAVYLLVILLVAQTFFDEREL